MSLTSLSNLRPAPDREQALARYRAMAAEYDASCRRILPLRRAAIELLGLTGGETVFDVACGTGATLLALAEKVGAGGKVIGIEQSPDMAEIARTRVADAKLAAQVTVLLCAVEDVSLAERADALLFSYTHDVLQNAAAVRRLMQHARPGAKVAVLATRFMPWWWGAPLNLFTGFRSRNYLTTFRGLSRPWKPLQPYCADIRVVGSFFLGSSCLAAGTVGSVASGPADRRAALASYRRLAAGYDATCWTVEGGREQAIALLRLKEGQTVLDVASGTGKSFAALSRAVGVAGRVIAVEQSPEMARIAQQRIDALSLHNVQQIVAPVEDATFAEPVDALLFHYTHDVLRTPAALARVLAAARPGARVVVVGFKLPTGWRAVLNPWFRHRARGYLSTFDGAHAPWSHLLAHVPDLRVERERFFGSGYVATGTVAAHR